MSIDVSDLRATIIPKSDQLNAEQLLAGPMTITVTEVRTSTSDEQPVVVHYEGENGRPFKPCKTMRKVLVLAWGEDGRKWPGRSMTLFNEPTVKFGGQEVGGIRISHLTDIPKDIQVALTATRGKKAQHIIQRLESVDAQHMGALRAAASVEELKEAFAAAYRSTKEPARRAAFKREYDARMASLTAPTKTLADFKAAITEASDAEVAALVLDEARDVLTPTENDELAEAYRTKWSNQ